MKRFALVCLPLITVGCWKPHQQSPIKGTPVVYQGLPACSGSNFPMNKGGSSSCCMHAISLQGDLQGEVWHVIGTQGNGGLGHRFLGGACSTESGSPPGTTLTFGPCGATMPQSDGAPNGKDVTIFKPVLPSSPNVCGYEYTNPDGSIVSKPEKYVSGQQPTYPGVTAACTYTVCVGDRTPGIELTVSLQAMVTVQAGASMGRVVSNPPGIRLSAAGKTSALFPSDVTLTAEPTSKHVRAVFSGACSKSGGFGERAECLVKLAPDPKVTVNFECEQGFTCRGGRMD